LKTRKRLLYRLADIGKDGKMHHGDGLIAIENRAQPGSIGDLALFERAPLHRPAIAAGEIVVGDRFVAASRERLAMAADIADAARSRECAVAALMSHRF
jgi:hypothetical protein